MIKQKSKHLSGGETFREERTSSDKSENKGGRERCSPSSTSTTTELYTVQAILQEETPRGDLAILSIYIYIRRPQNLIAPQVK